MKAALALAGLLVAVGLVAVSVFFNLVPINLESALVFFSQLSYIMTYISLLICLVTVIATFIWYPKVRKKFSSPI